MKLILKRAISEIDFDSEIAQFFLFPFPVAEAAEHRLDSHKKSELLP